MIAAPTSHTELFDWLRLIRSENVGPITFYQLLRKFGSAAQAIKALEKSPQQSTATRKIKLIAEKHIDAELKAIEKNNVHLICRGHSNYPEALETLPDAPPLLSVLGDPSLLNGPSVAIVGARNASLNGKKFAYNLANELGTQSYVTTSGLARGIDTQAHKGALKSHKTIAVLAGGVNVVYPPENETLYDQIVTNGAIVSEVAWGLQPQAKHFPRRNRLVSALSKGVVVVEAALKSGSLITARFALEQGREVFAVPGSPLDPRCRGSNNLLRHGAIVTEGLSDVLDNLPQFCTPATPKLSSGVFDFETERQSQLDTQTTLLASNELTKTILENLSYSAIGVDELIRQCQTSPQEVMNVLSELELTGKIERHINNKVSLAA